MAARRSRVCVHSPAAIEGIRQAARAAGAVRAELCQQIRPGLSTFEIDALAAGLIAKHGGVPAFLNYRGFPGNICVSVNDEVVHGIGSRDRILHPGDLVSIDVGVRLEGYVGDTAASLVVGGHFKAKSSLLLEKTLESLYKGISAARAGKHVVDIGIAVQKHAEAAGFSVVRDFVGHGCGRELHEPPEIPNFRTSTRGPRLVPGMVLAIEPMINAGTQEVSVDEDGWTVRTADGSLSAHFEHMVLITKKEAEILTWPKM